MSKKHLWENKGNNIILNAPDFYISYNPGDFSFLGIAIPAFNSDTGKDETALCIRKGEKYLILNGDFRKQYEDVFDQGLEACEKVYQKLKPTFGSSWSSNSDSDEEEE